MMSLRQLLAFVVIAGLSVVALYVGAGTWEGPKAPPTGGDAVAPRPSAPVSETDEGARFQGPQNTSVTVVYRARAEAPPEAIEFVDPQSEGMPVRIPFYVAWSFRAESVEPLAVADGSDRMAALCKGVELRTYRHPRTHEEAMALKSDNRDVVLERVFRADEARVYGRLATQLSDSGKRQTTVNERDTELDLSGNLEVQDLAESLTIYGDDLHVVPGSVTNQARGRGAFRLEHTAFVVTGIGVTIDRLRNPQDGSAVDRSRIEIERNPVFSLQPPEPGTPDAANFREVTIQGKGRAVIRREPAGDQQRLMIEMAAAKPGVDRVTMKQEGGRVLRADHLTITALEDGEGRRATDARSSNWRLRRLVADGRVHVSFQETDVAGETETLFEAHTAYLTHDVPAEGQPMTTLQGRGRPSRMAFVGDVPLDGGPSRTGRVHAQALGLVRIGPATGASVPMGFAAAGLRRIEMENQVTLRRVGPAPTTERDELDADSLIILAHVTKGLTLGDARDDVPESDDAVEVIEFIADGDVRLGGTRIEGRMPQLRGLALHTRHPVIHAGGVGTVVRMLGLRPGERIVDNAPPSESAPTATAPGPMAPPESDKPTWRVRQVVAEGEVDVLTVLGGPAFGIATHATGDVLRYDELEGDAELLGGTGRLARVQAAAPGGRTHSIEARKLRMDRSRGIFSANGGARSSVWTRAGGGTQIDSGSLLERGERKAPSVLELRTDGRIDIRLQRAEEGRRLATEAEQHIEIDQPFVAELRSEGQETDVLRANRMHIALTQTTRPAPSGGPGLPGTARRAPARTEPSAAPSRGAPATSTAAMEEIQLDAETITVTLEGETAKVLEARGTVLLRSTQGRLEGDHLTYRAGIRQADVVGTPARVVFREATASTPNRVDADRFRLRWTDAGPADLVAEGTPARPVRAEFYQAGKARGATSPPGALTRGGQLERFDLQVPGSLHITDTRVHAQYVWVERRVVGDDGAVVPARLYAPKLELRGTSLLGTQGAARTIASVHARRLPGPAPRNEVYLIYDRKPEHSELWGASLDMDVATEVVTVQDFDLAYSKTSVRMSGPTLRLFMAQEKVSMDGTPARGVTVEKAGEVSGVFPWAELDLRTGTPRVRGSRFVLRGR